MRDLFALPAQSPLPIILTEEFVARLSVANDASRKLKEMGYRIVRQNLMTDSGIRPEVRVEVGEIATVQPLIKLGNGFGKRRDGTRTYGYTVFDGVTVCWETWL